MSEVQHQQDADQIDGLLAAQIAILVAEEGVPGNFDKMWEFLQLLMPIVGAARASYHGAAVASMTRAMDGHGLEVAPAGLRQWSSNAAWKMLARAMGWNVYRDPIPKQFDSYPPAAQRALIERVVSFPEDPFDPVAVEQATQRIATGAIRHARAAGRDAVVDTADGNLVRRADTQEVLSPGRRDIEVVDGERVVVDTDEKSEVLEQWELEHPVREDYDRSAEGLRGKVLGWARVLTGAENCPWCAMLASRGPVYTETTVLTGTTRSASRDGLRYHDHCDCTAVLVVRGQPWEGEAQFTALQDLWEDARDNPTQLEMEEGLRTPQSRFDKRYRDLIEEDPHRFSLSDRPLSFDDEEAGERGSPPPELEGFSLGGTKALSPVPGVELHPPAKKSVDYFGDPEPLPNFEEMVKHSIWGWKDGAPPIDPLTTPRIGHSADSVRPTGTFFPETWSDQDIADAIAETMDNPTWVRSAKNTRMAVQEINGVMVKVQWAVANGEAQVMSAFPLFGSGVMKSTPKAPKRVRYEKDKRNELARYTRR